MSRKKSKSQAIINLRQPLWEQQHYEPPKSFSYFALFRDMGSGRSQVAVGSEVGIGRDTIYVMSSRWRWVERAAAWDKHLDMIRAKATEDAARTMSTRQAKLGMMLQDKAVVALENLDVSEATAKDVAQLADTGVKIERLARGESTGEDNAITIVLPIMPDWAKGSKYIRAQDVVEGDVSDDSKA